MQDQIAIELSAEHRSGQRRLTTSAPRIVIVEDQQIIRLMLQRIAQELGLEVVATAADGAEGVEAVLRERPDIVLMDVDMPRLDGLEAARIMMQSMPLPILLMTARPDDEQRRIAEEIGVFAYYAKPIGTQVLRSAIEAALGAAASPAEPERSHTCRQP